MHMPPVATERSPESATGFFSWNQSQIRPIRLFFYSLSGSRKAISGFRIPQSQRSGTDRKRVAGLTGFDPYATVRVTRSSQFPVSL
jgi:hypothetical protein